MPPSLASLERRVRALEQAGLGLAPDSIQAKGGQQISSAGVVTYDFNGHVHATGLDLDEASALNPASQQRVDWIRQATGDRTERIYGYRSAGSPALGLEVRPPASSNQDSFSTQFVYDGAAAPALRGSLQLGQLNGGNAFLDTTLDGASRRVFTGTGGAGARGSDFLQLALRANRICGVGTFNVTFPGGSAQSNVATVNHGMVDAAGTQVTPIFVLGGTTQVTGQYFAQFFSFTATQFQCRLFDINNVVVAAGTVVVGWLGIG